MVASLQWRGHYAAVIRVGDTDQLRREKAALKALASVPNVPKLLWYGDLIMPPDHLPHGPVRPALVRTRIAGTTLAEWGAFGKRMETAQLEAIEKQLRATLAQVHAEGFVHGDVKPANVVVTAQGRPVLIDWGSAAKIERTRKTKRHVASVEDDVRGLKATMEAVSGTGARR